MGCEGFVYSRSNCAGKALKQTYISDWDVIWSLTPCLISDSLVQLFHSFFFLLSSIDMADHDHR